MSGETEAQVSGWTVDTLRAFVLSQFEERDRRYQQLFDAQETSRHDHNTFLDRLTIERDQQVRAAFEASQLAINKADLAYEKRFDAANEFRQQLGDQARTFMPRGESELLHKGANDRMAALESRVERVVGHSGGIKDGWGYFVAGIGGLVGVGGLVVAVFHH